jgi:hypothetical protein
MHSSSSRSLRACLAFAALLAAVTANPARAAAKRSGGSGSNENISPPVTSNGTSNATTSAEDKPLSAGGAGARRGKSGLPPWIGTPVFVVGMPKAGGVTG